MRCLGGQKNAVPHYAVGKAEIFEGPIQTHMTKTAFTDSCATRLAPWRCTFDESCSPMIAVLARYAVGEMKGLEKMLVQGDVAKMRSKCRLLRHSLDVSAVRP